MDLLQGPTLIMMTAIIRSWEDNRTCSKVKANKSSSWSFSESFKKKKRIKNRAIRILVSMEHQ